MAHRSPIGAGVTLAALEADLHGVLAELRRSEPVSWVPALDGWLVTDRQLVIDAMRDAERLTVDDPRFSTAQVLGPSMLSLDGAEHLRHRQPFADALRQSEVRDRYTDAVRRAAHRRVETLTPRGRAELRTEFAGPLAADVMRLTLELVDTDTPTLLAWYEEIVAATVARSEGCTDAPLPHAVAALADCVHRTITAGDGMLAGAAETLAIDEVVSNAGVMLFGGLETSEGAAANVFLHLLSTPGALEAVRTDRSLVAVAVEESLRLEPSVVRLDRYATAPLTLGEAAIEPGDFVMLSLAAANRDPATFADPDSFRLDRPNSRQHVTFAHGPHVCPGMHLARLETIAAVDAALDAWPGLHLDPEVPAAVPQGTVFRKPSAVHVVW